MEQDLKQEQKEEVIEAPKETTKEAPKMRQIIIETDGTNINISKMEVAGVLEYKSILTALLDKIK